MSKENVSKFFQQVRDDEPAIRSLAGAEVETVIRMAKDLGLDFTEAELRTTLKEMLYSATSLPRGWGWELARRMGLVRE